MGNLITKNQFKETELNNTGFNDTIDSIDTPIKQEVEVNINSVFSSSAFYGTN